jgi:hypothetical protein
MQGFVFLIRKLVKRKHVGDCKWEKEQNQRHRNESKKVAMIKFVKFCGKEFENPKEIDCTLAKCKCPI